MTNVEDLEKYLLSDHKSDPNKLLGIIANISKKELKDYEISLLRNKEDPLANFKLEVLWNAQACLLKLSLKADRKALEILKTEKDPEISANCILWTWEEQRYPSDDFKRKYTRTIKYHSVNEHHYSIKAELKHEKVPLNNQ